jgi:hypothetical protein
MFLHKEDTFTAHSPSPWGLGVEFRLAIGVPLALVGGALYLWTTDLFEPAAVETFIARRRE